MKDNAAALLAHLKWPAATLIFFYLWPVKLENLLRDLFFIVFLIFFPAIFSSAQKVLTLEECAAYAEQNNISIRQSQLNEELSQFTLLQSKLNLLPNVNVSSGYYFNFGKTIDPTTNLFVNQKTQTNTVQLSGSWPIFTGLQRINTIKENQFNLLASQAGTANTKQIILLNVTGGFLDIVYAKENLINAEDQLKLTQQQLERTQLLVDAGTLSQGSLYDIQAQAAQDEVNRVTVENQLALSKLNLSQLMNIKEPFDVSIPQIDISSKLITDLNIPVDSIYETAERQQPSIKNAEYNLLSSQRAEAVSKGALFPTLSFFGSLSTNYSDVFQRVASIDTLVGEPFPIGFVQSNGEVVLSPSIDVIPVLERVPYGRQFNDNFGQAFGFTLDIPIFNNWNTRTNIRRSKVNVLNAQYDLESARLQLRKDIETAYQDAVAAKNSYQASLKSVEAFQKAFDDATRKFNLGALTSLDYTTVKNNLSKAQSDLLQSKYRYIFRLKVLDLYQGKPLTL